MYFFTTYTDLLLWAASRLVKHKGAATGHQSFLAIERIFEGHDRLVRATCLRPHVLHFLAASGSIVGSVVGRTILHWARRCSKWSRSGRTTHIDQFLFSTRSIVHWLSAVLSSVKTFSLWRSVVVSKVRSTRGRSNINKLFFPTDRAPRFLSFVVRKFTRRPS